MERLEFEIQKEKEWREKRRRQRYIQTKYKFCELKNLLEDAKKYDLQHVTDELRSRIEYAKKQPKQYKFVLNDSDGWDHPKEFDTIEEWIECLRLNYVTKQQLQERLIIDGVEDIDQYLDIEYIEPERGYYYLKYVISSILSIYPDFDEEKYQTSLKHKVKSAAKRY